VGVSFLGIKLLVAGIDTLKRLHNADAIKVCFIILSGYTDAHEIIKK
jgi:hypothetical protein